MDAPDPVVRSAMAKAMNPGGLPPMTQKELNRLLGRQYLEAEDRKNQAQNTTLQTMRMRQDIGSGQSPAIDVRQYAGSMYAAPGSYSSPRPFPSTQGGSIERSADELLKSRFGQMLPGQVEVSTARVPSMDLIPEQPEAPSAPTVETVQEVSGLSGRSPIEQLLGRNLAIMQGAGSMAQQGGAPTPSNVFSFTPAAISQQQAQQRIEASAATNQRKQMISTLSAMAGLGQDITKLNLPPDIIAEASAAGAKMKKELAPKFPASLTTLDNGRVYIQAINTETGEPYGAKVPVRDTANLPGTAKPQSKGVLVPARDQNGNPIPGIFFDPETGQFRSQSMMSPQAAMMDEYGFGGMGAGASAQATQQTARKGVKTYEQLLNELRGNAK